MEAPEEITPAPILGQSFDNIYLLDSKTYKLPANDNNIYELKMSLFSETLLFKIRPLKNISLLNYEKKFDYEEIAKILFLEKSYYKNVEKIFTFCDKALNDKKVTIYPELEKHQIKVILKKKMDYDEVDCEFYLHEKKNTKDEMIQILIDELNTLKLQKSNNNNNISNIGNFKNDIGNNNINNNIIKDLNDKINKLVEKNELFEVQFNSMVDENALLRNKISDMEKTIKNLENKISNIEKNNNSINISGSNSLNNSNNNIPQINISNKNFIKKLEYKETITTHHSNSGWLRQFVVYRNKKDNHDYLVYNNVSNHFSLDIYRVFDKQLIRYLKGHQSKVSVIKYFIKNNTNEYLLSCDEKKVVICWSLLTYTQQFKIDTKMIGYIWDATVLFNISGVDLCIISSNSDEECTRIYDFNNNNQFIKFIDSSYNNKSNYLIPWYYNNNCYIIECCNSKVSINSIFSSQNYATLEKTPEGMHCCGYIYKDIYLCVTDYNNNFLRIWNLLTKSVEKEISYEGWFCFGVTPWNDDYSIIASSEGLIILDINQGKMVMKIIHKKANNLCGIQKVNSAYNGECIFCSNQFGSIILFK